MMATLSYSKDRSKTEWEPLIAALRAELQEFGGLIRLLNDEQDNILANPAHVATPPESIIRQHALAFMSARIRGGLMTLPGSNGERRAATAPEILEDAPDEIRPLLGALFMEVENLALRAGDRTYQNDWLRKRAPLLATAADASTTVEAG
ncbi:MAG TPA: hypothetical protein VMM36_18810 [Opitutaceae bacterium]|nr:hypothetical protein [Opitutaceae bacterium]